MFVAYGVIFRIAVVLSLATMTVTAHVVKGEVCGGFRVSFCCCIFGPIRYPVADNDEGNISNGGISGGSVLLHVPFI